MSAEPEKSILIRAYECKMRSKFNLQEFFDIVNADPQLKNLSEKGLFILYLCEMLLKAYIAHGLKVRNFINEFDKKDVKKRQKREGGDGGQRRKRKTKKPEGKRGQKTLEELSEQSLASRGNGSNNGQNNNEREKARDLENRTDQISHQHKQGEKEEKSNGSKNIAQDKNIMKFDFNKITEVIPGHEETYATDIDFLPNTGLDQNSQTSSSQYSGQISNLSEKVKIFTSVDERRTTATRKKTAANRDLARETKTRKKRVEIIDQSTLLQETRVSDQDLTVNYMEISHFDTQEIHDFDLTYNFIKNLGKDEKLIAEQLFTKENIERLRNLIPQDRPIHPFEMGSHFDGMIPTDDNQINYPIYSMSQPTSVPFFEPEFFKQALELKDSQVTFDQLLSRTKKDKATLFYELLWREQNDEITLIQDHPEAFSEIRVKQK